MAKKIVLCFDGTWNKPKQNEPNTNVVRLYNSILGEAITEVPGNTSKPPLDSIIKWYDAGVGTKLDERLRGGLFGYGLSRNIRQGYKFLIDRYEDGDEIYLFGFSRGAYTARSLAGLIRNIGLIGSEHVPSPDPDDNQVLLQGYELYRERDATAAESFRSEYSRGSPNIKFLGVWDTVGSLGVPLPALISLNEDRYEFHDTKLSRLIEHAYQAVAVDEHRKDYKPTLWNSQPKPGQQMEQFWFVGAHSDVGGGSAKLGFSDIALAWMQEKANLGGSGLAFDEDMVPDLDQRFLSQSVSNPFNDFFTGWIWTFLRGGRFYRPVKALPYGNESLHATTTAKLSQDNRYRPKNPGLV